MIYPLPRSLKGKCCAVKSAVCVFVIMDRVDKFSFSIDLRGIPLPNSVDLDVKTFMLTYVHRFYQNLILMEF